MAVADKSARNTAAPVWPVELLDFPIGVAAGVAIVLTGGHPWSVLAFSPEVWGVWSAPLFAVNFTVMCIAAWRLVVLIQRVVRHGAKPTSTSDVWDRDLDG